MYSNKKGVSELTSFVFLTLLIIVASTTAYVVSNNFLDDTLIQIDRDRMEVYMKKMQRDVSSISTFDNTTRSFTLEFETGRLVFEGNQVYYQSLAELDDTQTYCFRGVCYQGRSGFERIYFNLTGGYTFSRNFSLEPDSYIIIFKNQKAENEILLRFR